MIRDYIYGKTEILGLIGNPISHTLSPFIHNTIAKRLSDSYAYVPFPVEAEALCDSLKGAHALNIKGLNVTVPYKKDVLEYLCDIDDSAKIAGAVNTLKYTKNGYKGYNTDIYGVMSTFEYANVNMYGKDAMILGAGGSACAAAIALCNMGASNIYIVNRTMETAKSLANNISKYYYNNIECLSYEQINEPNFIEAVIQTTTLGFGDQKHQSPIKDKTFFNGVSFVLDAIYSPWETVFLKDARQSGTRAVNGFDMLVFQAVASYEIWTEKKLSTEFVEILKNDLADFFIKTNPSI